METQNTKKSALKTRKSFFTKKGENKKIEEEEEEDTDLLSEDLNDTRMSSNFKTYDLYNTK